MGERAVLIKFGSFEHVSQFRDEGLLYMNNLPYFWKVEDEELRGDNCDGVVAIYSGSSGKARIATTDEEFEITRWTMRVHPPEPEKINIFCMYALRQSSFPVDSKNSRFGDHAVVVIVPKFIDRVQSYIDSHKMVACANLMEYVAHNYTGEMGSFRKLDHFAYQSEWRLVCKDGSEDIRQERIGSIQDISIIMPYNEINEWADKAGLFESHRDA